MTDAGTDRDPSGHTAGSDRPGRDRTGRDRPGRERGESEPIGQDEREHDPTGVWVSAGGAAGGHPVVLVHGTLDRSAGLVKLARRLGETFRVIRFDRRGYGRSRAVGPPYSVAANVSDLVSIIDRIGEPLALFGHSFGGNLCLAAAEQHPAVRAVAVYESPLSWLPEWTGSSGFADPADWQSDPELAAERFMRRLVGDAVWERLPRQTRDDRRAEGTTMVAELSDLRSGRPPWDASGIEVPVLALYGQNGLDHHRWAMEQVASAIASGSLIEVADANHFGPNARPAAVAQVIAEFFQAAFAAQGRIRQPPAIRPPVTEPAVTEPAVAEPPATEPPVTQHRGAALDQP